MNHDSTACRAMQFGVIEKSLIMNRSDIMVIATLRPHMEHLPITLKSQTTNKTFLFFRILRECRKEWGQNSSSSDEDEVPRLTNQEAVEAENRPISEQHYKRMLRKHRKRRLLKRVHIFLICAHLCPQLLDIMHVL